MVGPYKLLHVLGRGGTSVVWRGDHTLSGQSVAIKVLTTERAQNARYREFFANEVRAVARLNHANITQILDAGLVDESNDELGLHAGNPYVVTEYVAGGTLEEFRPGLNWRAVRDLLKAMLDALAHAHAHGVLHLDIKPGNILLRHSELPLEPILTDFGISRVLEGENASHDSRVTGTPRYMAPEQVTGEPDDLGPWTDLYSLGCLAHKLICGRVPFDGENATETLRAHVRHAIPEFRPIISVPPGVKEWLHSLLAKDPNDRPASAAQAAWLLQKADLAPMEDWIEAQADTSPDIIDPKMEPTVITTPVEMTTMEVVPLLGPRPPLPLDWREHEESHMPSRPRYVGLGMVRHRVPPFLGRETERDQVWKALELAQSGPQAVIIRGVAGTGKTRLAEWGARIADELGLAVPLIARFHHSRLGLGPLEEEIGRCARILHLKPERAIARFRNFLGSIRPVDEGDFLDAVAFCDAVSPGTTSVTRAERQDLLYRLITRMAERIPMVIVFDDAHREPDAWRFADKLLNSKANVLVVLSVSSSDSLARAGLESLTRSERAHLIDLEPLRDPELAAILQRMLQLEPHLLEMVLERADGSPADALRYVMSWVEREMLVPGVDGYELVMPRDSVSRESSHELAFAAADALLGKIDASAREAALYAAVLGSEIRRQEWEAVLKTAILPGPDALIDQIVQVGLVVREPNGLYRFVAEDVRRAVIKLSADTFGSAHSVVAETLAKIHPMTDARVLERVAYHLEQAGKVEHAAELYTAAALRYHHSEGNEPAKRALDSFENLKSRFPDARFPVAARTADVARLWLEFDDGVFDLKTVVRALSDAERDGAFRAAGSAARLRVKILRKKSFEAANEAIEEAIEILERAGELVEAGTLMLSQGWNFGLQGQYEFAFQRLNQAQSIFRAEGDLHWVGKVDQAASFLYLQRGDHETARQRIDALIHAARSLGDRAMLAAGHAYLGEFERLRGNQEAALDHYSDVVALLGMDNLNGKIAMLNQSLCRIALGQDREALIILDFLQEDPAVRTANLHNHLTLGRLAVEFSLGVESPDFHERWVEVTRDIRHRSRYEFDLAWLLEHLAGLFQRRGHADLRDDAFGLSETIWNGLGRAHDAQRVAAQRERG